MSPSIRDPVDRQLDRDAVDACKGSPGLTLVNWSEPGRWSRLAGLHRPNQDVLSASDISHDPNVSETQYSGKSWLYPLYRFVYPLMYNKALSTQAGLDPSKPPTTWDEFINVNKKLKAAGIQPIELGLKDGFGGEILGSATFQKQIFSNYNDLIQMTVNGNFEAPLWKSWITRAAELRSRCMNKDVDSVSFRKQPHPATARPSKAAIIFGTQSTRQTIIASAEGRAKTSAWSLSSSRSSRMGRFARRHQQRLPGRPIVADPSRSRTSFMPDVHARRGETPVRSTPTPAFLPPNRPLQIAPRPAS